jgi:ATP-binding cassette subfamily B protein
MLSLKLFIKAFKHSLKLKMSYYYDTNIAKIMSEVTQDVGRISAISDKSILVSLIQVLKIVGGIIGLVIISWKLTLFVLALIPIKLVATLLLTNIKQKLVKQSMEQNSKFSFWYGETLNGISEIKLWNLYIKKISEFIKLKREMIKLQIKTEFSDELNRGLQGTIEALIFNTLYIIGASMIINSNFTLGGMFSFVMYSSYVIQPVALLSNILYQMSSVKPAMKRYLDFLDKDVEYVSDKDAISLSSMDKSFPGTIKFDNVHLAYRDADAVHNLSIEVKKGEKIALVGPNGSGKSSIINLLLRFYNPNQGKIYMDGVDISSINLHDYRNLFSVMSQRVHLFNTTIMENIRMNRNIEFDEIIKSCSESDALEFITNLEDKFDTEVGYRGSKLSGGERQKVALARVLSRNSKILVLDEATSNYDYESEQIFNNLIMENTSYDFIFAISHRPDILKAVDKILVIESSHIKGFGSYEELYGNNDIFTNMVKNFKFSNKPNSLSDSKVKQYEKKDTHIKNNQPTVVNLGNGQAVMHGVFE